MVIIQLFAAMAASFVAVMIGSGGDVLFLSSVLFVVPLLTHQVQNTFALGPLVAAQGIVATLIGGVAYSRIVDLQIRAIAKAAGVVIAGSLGSSFVAYLLPSTTLRVILALATTLGAVKVSMTQTVTRKVLSGGRREVGKGTMLMLFVIAVLTGGLGVGGGFLFFIVLTRVDLTLRGIKGMTLILTCTNLVTSLFAHSLTASVNLDSLGATVFGALVGSLMATLFIKRLDERVAHWGLSTLLIGSAAMSWFPIFQRLGF